MNKRLLPVLVATFALAAPAAAQQGLKLNTGSVGFGGLYSNVNSQNPYRFYEYRDMYSTFLSEIDVQTRSDEWWFNGFMENIGRTDQYFNLRGGKFNLFKYEVYGDWLQHNLSMRPAGATSPYSGIGTSTLTANFLNPAVLNPANWNDSFNFEKSIQNIGGMIEFSNIYVSPWFVRVDANEVRTTGINVASAANGTSPGNGFIQLPAPMDYVTRNGSFEFGYATKQGNFGINFLKSTFTNDNQVLKWTNPFFGSGSAGGASANQIDLTTLPPDNDLWKISANGALRGLPWGSTLAGRVTYSELTDSVGVFGAMLFGNAAAASYVSPQANNTNYDGKIKNTTVTVSLTSNPTQGMDTRLYYYYYDKQNDSTTVTFNNCTFVTPPTATTSCVNDLFSYTRNNAGGEVGYRFNPANRLVGVIDYNHVDRSRDDYPTTTAWTYGLEWRNNTFEWLGSRLGVSYIHRRSDFGLGNAGANANDPAWLERYIARFDASNVDQTRVKLVLDSSPIEYLDLGFEGYWKWNDYKDNPDWSPLIGRTKDTRQEYYASVSYGNPDVLRVTLFGDIEFIQYDSYHRNISAVTPGAGGALPQNLYNPNTAPFPALGAAGTPACSPTSCNYNWDATNYDTNWALGLGTDWKALERLTVKGSAIWSRTQGWADIVSQNNFGLPFPIRSYDTSAKVTLNLKGVYQYTKNWEFTAGYAYENYRYSDDRYNSYLYVIPTPPTLTGGQASYLAGAYAYPNYSANIVYATAKYKF
jgi:hypothetical protein